jgi:KDO2-lipid IV(A) lauroyltransferase
MPIFYYLILMPLSKLPFWMLYGISDVVYYLMYYVFKYRRKVVHNNLSKSFPNLNKAEILKIEKKFFRHFCDLAVEAIKAFTISKKELDERFTHRNPELVQKYFDNNQHVTLVGGHYGNWELLAVSVVMHIPHRPIGLYTPLVNKFMNTKIMESRGKYGLWLNTYPEVQEMMKDPDHERLAVIFGADQCPRYKQKPYWMQFLNQETPVNFGTEKFARDNNTPVIYGVIHKLKRGHYEMEYKLICEDPKELPLGGITEAHTKLLEDNINNEPAFWLWTHKRWKRSKAEFERRAKEREALSAISGPSV